MNFDKQCVARVFSEDAIISGAIPQNPSFSIDSRTLQQGDIFIALRGSTYDGHDFVQEALHKGAAGFIIQHDRRDSIIASIPTARLPLLCMIVVYDTMQALFDCAHAWRMQFTCPVVAVTG
jgi:UDP-N-acetylmuramoyl-tripeptide--D-alanyl-D-alanine ligase